MKALVMSRPGDVALTEMETPRPGPGQVLIKVMSSGICTNDVRDYLGDCSYSYPRIGGHEYAGVIVELGTGVNARRFQVGQRVVNYIIDDCKECYYCKTGNENICEDFPHSKTFTNPGGISGYRGFAEYVLADSKDVVVYEHQTDWVKMALTEPLACVVNSVNRADVQLGQDVLVIGGGAMGLLHVLVARLRGARVILSEPMEERRKKGLELGCDAAIDPTRGDVVVKVRKLTGERGADAVFDTVANPRIASQAVEMCAPTGICVIFSSIHPNEPVPVSMQDIHALQKIVTGAESPTTHSYFQAVQLIDKGIVDPTPLVQEVVAYTEFQRAMAMAIRPDTYKVVVRFGDWT